MLNFDQPKNHHGMSSLDSVRTHLNGPITVYPGGQSNWSLYTEDFRAGLVTHLSRHNLGLHQLGRAGVSFSIEKDYLNRQNLTGEVVALLLQPIHSEGKRLAQPGERQLFFGAFCSDPITNHITAEFNSGLFNAHAINLWTPTSPFKASELTGDLVTSALNKSVVLSLSAAREMSDTRAEKHAIDSWTVFLRKSGDNVPTDTRAAIEEGLAHFKAQPSKHVDKVIAQIAQGDPWLFPEE